MTIMTHPPRVLYPAREVTGHDLCETCFQSPADGRVSGLAVTADRRVSPTGRPVQTCAACWRALAAGLPVALPTGRALEAVWLRLARYHVNEEIGTTLVVAALEALAGHLRDGRQDEAFAELEAALIFRQQVDEGDITAAEVEPELAHPDVLWEAAKQGGGEGR